MSGQQACDRALLGENPFRETVARLDLPMPPVDVETLHGEVRRALEAAIEDVRTRRRPEMVLVKGDPGQGKTHQLAQLKARAAQGDYYFVEVPPLKGVEAPFRHILRYTVQALLARQGTVGGSSALERLLWECLRGVAVIVRAHALDGGETAVVEELDQALLGDGKYVDAFGILAQERPGVGEVLFRRGREHLPLAEPDFGRVLCRMTDPLARAAVFDWLRCAELPDEDLALLQVRRSIDSEERSFEVLKGLLSLSTRPVALCFDQLEATGGLLGTPGIEALSSALMEIYQQLPVCIALMCQVQYWGALRGNMQQALFERIRELPPLSAPSGDEAVALVEARLGRLWASAKVTPPYPTYPFPAAVVKEWATTHRPTVRALLAYFGGHLDEMRAGGRIVELGKARKKATASTEKKPGVASPIEALETTLTQKIQSLPEGSLGTPAGRDEQLRNAVARLLAGHQERARSLGGLTVRAVEDPPLPKSGPRPPAVVTVAGKGGERRLALDVDSGDPRNVWRALDRLQGKVARREADLGLLLREESLPLSERATRAQALVRSLEQHGGGVAYLDEALAHRLVASELLLDAVASAEVWAGDRAVETTEAATFLLEHAGLGEGLAPLLSRVLERPARVEPREAAEATRPVAPLPTTLEERTLAEVGRSGPVMSVSALATALGEERAAVEREALRLVGRGLLRLGKDRDGELTVGLIRGRP